MAQSTDKYEVITCRTRKDWLDLHRDMIGASAAAALCGEGYANQSPVSVWYDMVGDEPGDDNDGDERLMVGLELEPGLMNVLHRVAPDVKAHALNHARIGDWAMLRSRERPYVGATPDAMTFDGEPVELKAIDHGRHEWKDEPPLKYQIQVQHQLYVTGAERGILFGLVGLEPRLHWIERNDRFIESLMGRLDEFWKYVEKREMPPLDGSVATRRILDLLHPDDNGETVELDEEIDEAVKHLEYIKTLERFHTAKRRELENRIRAAVGDNTYGVLPGGRRVSLKTQTRKSYTVDETSFRRLHIEKPKGE